MEFSHCQTRSKHKSVALKYEIVTDSGCKNYLAVTTQNIKGLLLLLASLLEMNCRYIIKFGDMKKNSRLPFLL